MEDEVEMTIEEAETVLALAEEVYQEAMALKQEFAQVEAQEQEQDKWSYIPTIRIH